MCGIVGLSFSVKKHLLDANKAKKAGELFTAMMIEAQSRGSAASGLYIVNREGNKHIVNTFKSPLSAKRISDSDAYKKIISKIGMNTLHIVGHTRAVTGDAPATNNRNNHPHVVGKFIGVHNGVIRNELRIWNSLAQYGYKPTGKCDSEAIFALLDYAYTSALSKFGTKLTDDMRYEALRNACRFASIKLDGWYTVVFTCLDLPSRVCILRDGKFSEMAMDQVNDHRMVAFASTQSIIGRACRTVGLKDISSWVPYQGETTMINSDLEYIPQNLKVERADTTEVLVSDNKELSKEEEEQLAITRGAKK